MSLVPCYLELCWKIQKGEKGVDFFKWSLFVDDMIIDWEIQQNKLKTNRIRI